ncbi:MAG: hypothetical protein HY049_06905 [Acidobacteria bacterium]|nr:hypothetical protein [Acidobacteriota bacterium]
MRAHSAGRPAAAGLAIFLAIGAARAEQLPFTVYTTTSGLPRDGIACAYQDSRGFIWLCTADGLSRFDGYEFTTIGPGQGMPSPVVSDVIESRDGTLWVATAAGLARIAPHGSAGRDSRGEAGSLKIFVPEGEPSRRNLRTLIEAGDGSIWIGTWDGLLRFDPRTGSFESVEIAEPSGLEGIRQINAFLPDGEGGIWIATRYLGLLHRRRDGGLDRFFVPPAPPYGNLRALAPDGEGGFWAGGYEGLLHVAPGADGGVRVIARLTATDGLLDNQIYALVRTTDGRILAGGTYGVSVLTRGPGASTRISVWDASRGLKVLAVVALAEDRNGNVWIGSTYDGAWKLARDGLTTYFAGDGLPGPHCVSFLRDREGRLLASTHTKDLQTVLNLLQGPPFPAVKINVPSTNSGRGWGISQLTFQDHLGDWWVPTGHGLLRYSGVARWEDLARAIPSAIYTTKDGMPSDEIFRLFEDSRADVWISAYSVMRWRRSSGKIERIGPPILPAEAANAFAEDASGNVWLGYGGAELVRYRDGRSQTFTAKDGVPAGAIAAIFRDSRDRLWIASTDEGVARVDDPAAEKPTFVHYSTAEGLTNRSVNAVAEDRFGRIYLGTGKGVDVLDPATGKLRHLTPADGLAGSEISLAAADREGAVWFSSTGGVSRLVPRAPEPRSPPPVWITDLRVGGVRRAASLLGETGIDGIALAPDQRELEIGFVGLDFGVGERLRYQYRLGGAGGEWSAPTETRAVNFARLAPGAYRFAVRALNSDAQGSPVPATVGFSISPPIWQRGWFLLLAAAAAAGLVTAFHRLRVRRLLEVERVRTRIAADLHDDLGASLSRIAIQSELVRRPGVLGAAESQRILGDMGDSARALVESMSDIVWSIDPRRDDLASVVARLRQFSLGLLEPLGASFGITAPAGDPPLPLAPETRRHLYLILKEAVNNAAKHSGCRRVSIDLRVEAGRLRAEVRDDGGGFTPPEPSAPVAGRGGHGLQNLRARAAEMGGALRIASAPGEGTAVTLVCDLAPAGRHGGA